MSRVYEALKRVELERERTQVEEVAPPRVTSDAGAWWRGAGCGFAAGLVVACAVWGTVSRDRAAELEPVGVHAAQPALEPVAVHAARPALESRSADAAATAPAPDAPIEIPSAPPAPPASPVGNAAAGSVVDDATPADLPAVAALAPSAHTRPSLALQAGSFRDEGNASRLAAALRARGHVVEVVRRDGEPATWTVRVGAWSDRRAAAAARAALASDGHETFVVVRTGR